MWSRKITGALWQTQLGMHAPYGAEPHLPTAECLLPTEACSMEAELSLTVWKTLQAGPQLPDTMRHRLVLLQQAATAGGAGQ